MIFVFGNFRILLEIIVEVRDDESSQTISCMVNICFRKYSEIIGNFQKLLENIVRVRDDESLQTGSCRVNFVFGNFRKFLEIIGKYCWSAKR